MKDGDALLMSRGSQSKINPMVTTEKTQTSNRPTPLSSPAPKNPQNFESGMDIRSSSSSFPFDLLPVEIQSRILSLLPISTLLRCSAASRSLRRLIRSPSFASSYPNPNQPLFLFSDGDSPVADAYDPLLDRWLPLPLPLPPSTLPVHSPSGHLLLASEPSSGPLLLVVYSPLSSSSPPVEIPNTADGFCPLALISSGDRDFKILTVSTAGHRIQSRTFDSVTGDWTMGVEFAGPYTSISSCAVLNGVFYCLTCSAPTRLLALDSVGGGVWRDLDVNLPTTWLHKVLVFDGRLFAVGTVVEAEAWDYARVGIWEMNWVRMEFEIYCYMPEEYSEEFMKEIHSYIGHRNGIVCFIITEWDGNSWIFMCTLEGKRWWMPRRQEERKSGMPYCLVYAVEPYIDLVKGSFT